MRRRGLSDSTPYATEGTTAHKWGSDVLEGKCKIEGVPEEFREGVALYVNSIMADLEFGGEILGIEKFLDYSVDGRIGGTPDCVHRVGDCLIVTDFKYGFNFVPADAIQLKIYGFLAYRKYGRVVKTIELRVVQPRCESEFGQIRSTFWDRPTFMKDVADWICNALDQIDAHPDLRVPGDHCTYCPAVKVAGMPPCPAHVEKFQALLAEVPLPLRPKKEIMSLSENDQLKMILDNKEIINALIKHAEEAAHDRIYHGGIIEGYTLTESFKNREWSQSEDTTASALRDAGLTYNQIWVEKLISPAQAEKAGLKGKIDDLTVRESKGLKLSRDKQLNKEIKHSVKKLLADNPLLEKGKSE